MSGQIRVTSRYSGLLIYFVMFVEVVICGGLFSIFAYYRGSDFGNEFLDCRLYPLTDGNFAESGELKYVDYTDTNAR